jgi:hypothetical protein
MPLIIVDPNPYINNRNDHCLIAFYRNSTPVFLSKDIRLFDIAIKTALKHPASASLNTFNSVSRVPFFTHWMCNICLCMTVPIDPYFIAPQYLLPLLNSPIGVFSGKSQTGQSISLRNRRLAADNTAGKACVL